LLHSLMVSGPEADTRLSDAHSKGLTRCWLDSHFSNLNFLKARNRLCVWFCYL
jgi:hypothetical protein